MYKRSTTVINKTGLHARPASIFVNKANSFDSTITITNLSLSNAKTVNAKSIISILSLGMGKDSKVEIAAEGKDEVNAVDSLINLINTGFGE